MAAAAAAAATMSGRGFTMVRRAGGGMLTQTMKQTTQGRTLVVRRGFTMMRGQVVRGTATTVVGGRLGVLMQTMQQTAQGRTLVVRRGFTMVRREMAAAATMRGRATAVMERGFRVLMQTVEQTTQSRALMMVRGGLVVRGQMAAATMRGRATTVMVSGRLSVLMETIKQTTQRRGLVMSGASAVVVMRGRFRVLGVVVGRLRRMLMRTGQNLGAQTLQHRHGLVFRFLDDGIIMTLATTRQHNGDLAIFTAIDIAQILELTMRLHMSFQFGNALVRMIIHNDGVRSGVTTVLFFTLGHFGFIISIDQTTATNLTITTGTHGFIVRRDGDLFALVTALAALVCHRHNG